MISHTASRKTSHTAFTIPELLAVVAILSIVISVLLPAFARAKHQGRFIKELSAAKQLGVASIGYSTERHGRIIPGYANETAYLRVYAAQLRRKLEVDPSHPRHLITQPGMGYLFETS